MAGKLTQVQFFHGFSDADFRSMVETIEDQAIFFLDAAGYVCTWNLGAQRLKGYAAHEIVGSHFSVFYPPDMLDKRWPDYELMMAREQGRFEDEGWRIRKDGSRFWARIVITRIADDEGNIRGFYKITRDLTEDKKQEDELRNSEERFRLLVEGVKDYAIFLLDPGGFIASWNAGARVNTGYEAQEVLGKHFSIFYPADAIAKDWPNHELQQALADGRYEEEGWRLRKDGTRYWANVVITRLQDASGRHRGFAKVTRDLTEKRRVAMLESEGRRITAFIAMLAHELRNPLAPIANAIELLKLEPSPSQGAEIARDIISRQQKQLARLVEDLLDMSRITTGRIHLEKRPVELHDAAREALEAIVPLCQEKRQSIEKHFAEQALWIAGDRARLIQIVSNLLHNAMKFTHEGGTIIITIGRERDKAFVRVKDNGCGIEPDRLPQLFMRFEQRVDDETKTHGGLGLGLSLVQQLTVLQQGQVFASSTGVPGQGSEFTIQFPIIRTPAAVEQLPASAQKTVLIVDDNRDAADSLAMMLQAKGYQTHTVYCGKDAIEAIETRRPSLVILDIGLPDIDGVEVVKTVSAGSPQLPVFIAMTGYGMDSDRERSFKAGFQAHLTKPVDPHRVYDLVKSALSE